MWYAIAFIVGGIFATVFMCLFQINGPESRAEEKLLDNQVKKGGIDE